MPAQISRFNWRRHSREVIGFQREIYETNFPGFVASEQFLREYGGEIRRAAKEASEGLFVLEMDRRVVGFLWVSLIATMVDPCIGYIKNVYVVPELRGRQYGKQLAAYAEEWCLHNGVTRISLDASCCNRYAMQFYDGLGFEIVRVRMEKRLMGDVAPDATSDSP